MHIPSCCSSLVTIHTCLILIFCVITAGESTGKDVNIMICIVSDTLRVSMSCCQVCPGSPFLQVHSNIQVGTSIYSYLRECVTGDQRRSTLPRLFTHHSELRSKLEATETVSPKALGLTLPTCSMGSSEDVQGKRKI